MGIMDETESGNNMIRLRGEIVSGLSYSHESYGEYFYIVSLAVKRLSGRTDILPLMVSDLLIDEEKDYLGRSVEAEGQFRSYSFGEYNRTRNRLYVFVTELFFPDACDEEPDWNKVFLDGFLCKAPLSRVTPLGRKITELMLAVGRHYGKADYLPCIVWDRKATASADLPVSTHLRVWGRLQSREYMKQLPEGEYTTRTAYEVSVYRIELRDQQIRIQ